MDFSEPAFPTRPNRAENGGMVAWTPAGASGEPGRELPAGRAHADRPAIDAEVSALRAIVEGTAENTGAAFFEGLVRHLARAVEVSHAFVAEFAADASRVRTLAYWGPQGILPNVEFDLNGTPCEEVLRGDLCHYPSGVRQRFPRDEGLVALAVESYLGVPLRDGQGRVLGHLAVFDGRPMPPEPRTLFVFRIFAARAAAELERLRIEGRLMESERHYRELYEEAPHAHVSADQDGAFLNVNRRAARMLGRPVVELIGTSFPSHFVDQAAARTALEAALAGEEVSGRELELRTRNGTPRWISVEMRPARDRGDTTRAVHISWLDATARVQAEADRARLDAQNRYLREEIRSTRELEEIVGRSSALASVLEKVARVAPTDATVLIQGETGTGKELIARAIHAGSRRRDRPLVKLNCATLPAGLVESELFGHERGAFTGAVSRHTGRFELADGGTIFLDEIGELPAEVQAKLLRVLQEREIDRVGSTEARKVDVRVIAATNRDLARDVRDRAFREDLYYRLNVFPLTLPPLRQRVDDIPLLAQYFLNRLVIRIGRRFDRIDPDAMRWLMEYPWPGNVRELENVLERAAILATGPTLAIAPDLLGTLSASVAADVAMTLEDVGRAHMIAVLGRTRWLIDGPRGAAAILGLHPNTLRSRLKKMGLTRPTLEFT